MVWTCLPFVRSGQNHPARAHYTKKGKKTRQTEKKKKKKMWENSHMEWKGLEFAKSQRAVENREKWRKLTVKSSVVPQ